LVGRRRRGTRYQNRNNTILIYNVCCSRYRLYPVAHSPSSLKNEESLTSPVPRLIPNTFTLVVVLDVLDALPSHFSSFCLVFFLSFLDEIHFSKEKEPEETTASAAAADKSRPTHSSMGRGATGDILNDHNIQTDS